MATQALVSNVVVVEAQPYVFGLRIPNREAAILTRRVLRLSLILMVCQVASSMYYYSWARSSLYFWPGVIGISVPLCGYIGARNRNRSLLGCFAGCNTLMAIFVPIAMVMLCMLTGWLQSEFPTVCPDGDEGMPVWPHNASIKYNGEPITCDELDQLVEGMGATYGITITTGLIGTMVACLGCTWGWKLRNTDYYVTANVVNTHTAVATVTSTAQQQGYEQAYQPAYPVATVAATGYGTDKQVPSV